MINSSKHLFVLTVIATCCNQTALAKPPELVASKQSTTMPVTLVQLVTFPQKFDGRRVKVSGYLHKSSTASRSSAVLCDKKNIDHRSEHIANSVSLIIDKNVRLRTFGIKPTAHDATPAYVCAEGIFKTKPAAKTPLHSIIVSKIKLVTQLRNSEKCGYSASGSEIAPHDPNRIEEVGDFPIRKHRAN